MWSDVFVGPFHSLTAFDFNLGRRKLHVAHNDMHYAGSLGVCECAVIECRNIQSSWRLFQIGLGLRRIASPKPRTAKIVAVTRPKKSSKEECHAANDQYP